MKASRYMDDLIQHEGMTTWMYCDVRGFVTIGIGNLVKTPDAAAALPFHHLGNGSDATDEEKRASWAFVNDAFTKGKSAHYYRSLTSLRLTEAFAIELAEQRLEEDFLPGIKRLMHDFEEYPLPARRALVDMAYNLGVGGLAHFHNMISACLERDWATAAKECHRSTSRESRNAWTSQMFIDAAVDSERVA